MNKKRLLKLAEFLETDPKVNTKGKFHLSIWMDRYQPYYYSMATASFKKAITKLWRQAGGDGLLQEAFDSKGNPHPCKTVGCALGWATTIPSFRKAGLYNASMPTYHGESGISAAMSFFDIGRAEAEALFIPDDYSLKDQESPKAVAKKIRKLVEGNLTVSGAIFIR